MRGDINNDGKIDIQDFIVIVNHFLVYKKYQI